MSSRFLRSSENEKERKAHEDQDDMIIRIVFVIHMDVPVVLGLDLEGGKGQTEVRGEQKGARQSSPVLASKPSFLEARELDRRVEEPWTFAQTHLLVFRTTCFVSSLPLQQREGRAEKGEGQDESLKTSCWRRAIATYIGLVRTQRRRLEVLYTHCERGEVR